MLDPDTQKRLQDHFREKAAGESDLLTFIDRIDKKFWSSPASVQHHHAFVGGLAIHSMELSDILVGMGLDNRRARLIGWGHDLDKMDRYIWNGSGWQYIPRKMFGRFHGSRGHHILLQTIPGLQDPDDVVRMCIWAHMGAFARSHKEKDLFREYSQKCEWVVKTCEADEISTMQSKEQVAKRASQSVETPAPIPTPLRERSPGLLVVRKSDEECLTVEQMWLGGMK